MRHPISACVYHTAARFQLLEKILLKTFRTASNSTLVKIIDAQNLGQIKNDWKNELIESIDLSRVKSKDIELMMKNYNYGARLKKLIYTSKRCTSTCNFLCDENTCNLAFRFSCNLWMICHPSMLKRQLREYEIVIS